MVRNSSMSTRSRNSCSAAAPERVGLPVQVEARHLREPDAFVQVRVRRPREDLDLVPEGDQLAAQVAHVDALTTAVRLAAIGQQRATRRDMDEFLSRARSRRAARWLRCERVRSSRC
jgi:hypothetical protein